MICWYILLLFYDLQYSNCGQSVGGEMNAKQIYKTCLRTRDFLDIFVVKVHNYR